MARKISRTATLASRNILHTLSVAEKIDENDDRELLEDAIAISVERAIVEAKSDEFSVRMTPKFILTSMGLFVLMLGTLFVPALNIVAMILFTVIGMNVAARRVAEWLLGLDQEFRH